MLDNLHTFKGRMYSRCPKKEVSFYVSKSELTEMSIERAYWIKGFLTGNAPETPINLDGEVDFKSKEYET